MDTLDKELIYALVESGWNGVRFRCATHNGTQFKIYKTCCILECSI